MKLVYHIVNKYYPNCATDEDIIQCGMIGLCDAAKRWDASKSKFSTFACLRIHGEIKNEIARRIKHQGILSLDYEVDDGEGDKCAFGDFVAAEDDLTCIELAVDFSKLNEREQEICKLCTQGLSFADIGRKLGISRQAVWKTTRKIRALRGLE